MLENENLQPNAPESEDTFGLVMGVFRDHPGLLGTLIYVQISSVGIVYIWALFSEFDINVFDFAEAHDFLLAAFKEPLSFFMAVLTVLLLVGQTMFMRWLRKKRGRRVDTPIYITALVVSGIVVYTVFPPYMFAKKNARKITQHHTDLVTVNLKAKDADVNGLMPDGPISLFGTTDRYVFFFSHKSSVTVVVPNANIGSIVVAMKQEK